MLTQLTIRDFAIIDHIEINFKGGLTVITGETGAGKSIIVDALDFLLGSRASTDLIRTDSRKAVVEATFLVEAVHQLPLRLWLENNEFEILENQLIISRELTAYGSKAKINGSIANVSHLHYLREHLLDIHEQTSHIELLKEEKQLGFLDSFGDENHKKLLSRYKKVFSEYQGIKNKLASLKESTSSAAKKNDFLTFQVNEIKSADIKNLNEDIELEEKREILLNKKELVENANMIYEIINGVETLHTTSLDQVLSEIKKLINRSTRIDKSFEPYLEMVESISDGIKDLSSFIMNYSQKSELNENDLKVLEERLDLLYRLKKKYGGSLEEVKNYFHKIERELNELESIDSSQDELEKMFSVKQNEINDLALKLTRSREKVTRGFVDSVNEELQTLGFKHAIFVVEFLDTELSYFGKEQIQFLFTANPDEPPKPITKVASGGELSRIMLAIKSITSPDVQMSRSLDDKSSRHHDITTSRHQDQTIVLDEIDIGVSGEIAASVAKKLYKISGQNQVICITHQPIIAAMADANFLIEKRITDGETKVIINEVAKDEKIEAIANLLTPEKRRSDGITEDAKIFARSLLENANRVKEKEFLGITPIFK